MFNVVVKIVFMSFDSKIYILQKKYNSQTAVTCGQMTCKPGQQESAIYKGDHPLICLKMPCKSTIIQCCNASLCKKVGHYFCHGFVLFTFNSNQVSCFII